MKVALLEWEESTTGALLVARTPFGSFSLMVQDGQCVVTRAPVAGLVDTEGDSLYELKARCQAAFGEALESCLEKQAKLRDRHGSAHRPTSKLCRAVEACLTERPGLTSEELVPLIEGASYTGVATSLRILRRHGHAVRGPLEHNGNQGAYPRKHFMSGTPIPETATRATDRRTVFSQSVLRDTLAQHPGSNATALANASGLSVATVQDQMGRLVAAGHATVSIGKGKRTLYRLVEAA